MCYNRILSALPKSQIQDLSYLWLQGNTKCFISDFFSDTIFAHTSQLLNKVVFKIPVLHWTCLFFMAYITNPALQSQMS